MATNKGSIAPIDFLNKLSDKVASAGLLSYEEYLELSKKPEGHFCDNCKAQYRQYNYEQRQADPTWVDVFPVCRGSRENLEISLDDWTATGGSAEEYEVLQIENDINKWAAAELGLITSGMDYDRDGEVKSMDRWYQRHIMNCSAQLKVLRMGRRTGKTVSMRVETLHALHHNDDFTVVLIAPFESQLIKFEEVLMGLIDKSSTVKDNFKKWNKTKHTITFHNGSKLEGYCTGGDKQSKTADRVRGAGANMIVIDEADYISEDALQAVLAVMSDDRKCRILLSSTPTGKRKFFYQWCVEKQIGFKEWMVYSHASPSYTKQADTLYRSTLSEDRYRKEYLAEFGSLIDALISPECINKAVESYDILELRAAGPKANCKYIIGVDWNGRRIGTTIVVIEFNPNTAKYKLVDKVIVKDTEYNYENSCWAAIKSFDHWKASWMYVDSGHGDMQIEMIKKTARQLNNIPLQKGLVDVPMGGFQIIKDPLTGLDTKKHTKEFAINLMVNAFENQRIVIPYSENYKDDDEDWGLIPQLYDLAKEKVSDTGRVVFAKSVDHTMTAMYLALLGFHMKLTDIGRVAHDAATIIVSQGDLRKLAGGITIVGATKREQERQAAHSVKANEFVMRANKLDSGYHNKQASFINADNVEWKNGIPMHKHDNRIASVPTRDLGIIRRGSF